MGIRPTLFIMSKNLMYHRNFYNPDNFPIPEAVNIQPTQHSPFPQQKKGIGVTPGAVVGAIVGAGMAHHSGKKEFEKRIRMAESNINSKAPTIDGNYYNQVQNLANNLEVVFTPISAIYVVKNGQTNFTLDTVEVGEMNDDLKDAWRIKDGEYFKGLMLGKVYSEMQLAEQSFAKRFAKKQLGIKDMITKEASDTSFIDEMNEVDTISYVLNSGNMFNEETEILAKAIIEDMEKESEEVYIATCLDRPFEKYAGVFKGIKSSLGLNTDSQNLKKIKKNLENPSYIASHVKIGFFPDRVVFSVDNQLVGTLALTSMNEEGYAHFQKQDQKYFKNFFVSNIKDHNYKKASVHIDSVMEKVAEDVQAMPVTSNGQEMALLSSSTHPVVIYLILSARLGLEWLEFDMTIIERVIKTEFGVQDIPETTMNKIMAILMANQSSTPFVNAYAFEKTVLALCAKPVDFFSKEKSSVYIQDIVFAIDVLDRVTPHDDIYDNFSVEVLSYIADALAAKDIYVYNPTNIVGSAMEPAFNEALNEFLARAIKGKMTLDSIDPTVDDEVRNNCEYVADNALGILKSIRRYMVESAGQLAQVNRGDLIDTLISKKSIREDLSYIVKKQVISNLSLDDILSMYEDGLQKQLQQYGVTRPGEV